MFDVILYQMRHRTGLIIGKSGRPSGRQSGTIDFLSIHARKLQRPDFSGLIAQGPIHSWYRFAIPFPNAGRDITVCCRTQTVRQDLPDVFQNRSRPGNDLPGKRHEMIDTTVRMSIMIRTFQRQSGMDNLPDSKRNRQMAAFFIFRPDCGRSESDRNAVEPVHPDFPHSKPEQPVRFYPSIQNGRKYAPLAFPATVFLPISPILSGSIHAMSGNRYQEGRPRSLYWTAIRNCHLSSSRTNSRLPTATGVPILS